MGIFGNIIKAGAAAAAAFAAVKIGEKYKEKNPDGSAERTVDAVKEAAADFYRETAETVKEKAPGVIDAAKGAAKQAADFAKEKAPGAAAMAEDLYNKAKEAAPGIIGTAKEKTREAMDYAREVAPEAAEKAEELYNKAKDAVSSLGEEPVDGEVVEFEDVKDEAEAEPAEETKDE